MTLNEFIHNLNKLIEDNEEWGELQVVTSKDEEGNGYNAVYFSPSLGEFNSLDGEFYEVNLREQEIADGEREGPATINAVCVN